ncbi:MarR family winged helix-turn-helix transcriptional regulator [Kineococcus terrestris]|uniref:MarR family winged helix-turn-helix transcriptional regulator n=1 Tax=Kineococcus terrestris TaxID=2044856 RepID=UPI0034DB14AA
MVTGPAENLERELAVLLRRSRAISRETARSVHPELEPEAYSLLVRLDDVGSARPSDLAAFFGIGKPTLSRQVQLLERLGFLERAADPDDGRAVLLTLSPTGLEQVHAARQARRQRLHDRLASWDDADMAQLADLLARFNASII